MSSTTRQKVICDTNIWYNIAEGIIDPNDHLDVDLIATGVNVLEFASTENFQKDIELVKRAVMAMEKHHAGILEYEPWSYLLSYHVDVAYDPKPVRQMFLDNLAQFQGLVDGQFDDLFQDEQNVTSLIAKIQLWNQPTIDLIHDMNAGLVSMRAKGEAEHGSRAAYKRHLRGNKYTFVDIMLMVRDILAAHAHVDPKDLNHLIDWNNMELLIHVWDAHFKEVALQSQGVFHTNDFFDVTNMAYVGREDLYWTAEKSWIRLIEDNPETASYLYKPSMR